MKIVSLFIGLFFLNSYAQDISGLDLKLEDVSGNSVLFSSLIGKTPVYINFWALWCVPCRTELKPLNIIYNKFKEKGFEVISINIDNTKSYAKVSSFLASQRLNFKIFFDPESKIFKTLNGENLPFSLLINKNGKVEKIRTGYFPGDEKIIEKEIEELLKDN